MANNVTVQPTSRDTALAEELILRETQVSRLLFRPMLVNNVHDPEAAVRGHFVFQKKSRKGDWADHAELRLSALKAEEWVKLELHSDELLKLYNGLSELYSLYGQEGIPKAPTRFLKVEAHFEAILDANPEELVQILNLRREPGTALVGRLLDWFSQVHNQEHAIDQLESLGSDALQRLNTLVGLGNLKAVLSVWKSQKQCSDEEFWQKTLTEHAYVLSQVFSFPVVVLKEKAYLGGKGLENTGGSIVDFLVANKLTGNAALVEIKTPVTKLVAGEYRNGVYSMSPELVGAVMQAANYRDTLQKQYIAILGSSQVDFEVFEPECLVIIGSIAGEKLTKNRRRSLELYRNGLKNVKVVTYDELFEKVELLIRLLEGEPAMMADDDWAF